MYKYSRVWVLVVTILHISAEIKSAYFVKFVWRGVKVTPLLRLLNLSRMTQGMSVPSLVLVLKIPQNGSFLSLKHPTTPNFSYFPFNQLFFHFECFGFSKPVFRLCFYAQLFCDGRGSCVHKMDNIYEILVWLMTFIAVSIADFACRSLFIFWIGGLWLMLVYLAISYLWRILSFITSRSLSHLVNQERMRSFSLV